MLFRSWKVLREESGVKSRLKRRLASMRFKDDIATRHEVQISEQMQKFKDDDELTKQQQEVKRIAQKQIAEMLQRENVKNPLSDEQLSRAIKKVEQSKEFEKLGLRRSKRFVQKAKSRLEERIQNAEALIGRIGVQTFGDEEHVFVVESVDYQKLRKWNKKQLGTAPAILQVVYPPQHKTKLWDMGKESVPEVQACCRRYLDLMKKGIVPGRLQKKLFRLRQNILDRTWDKGQIGRAHV